MPVAKTNPPTVSSDPALSNHPRESEDHAVQPNAVQLQATDTLHITSGITTGVTQDPTPDLTPDITPDGSGMDYSRYDFLKTAGSATIMAFFGITLASCSSSVTDSGTGTDPDPTDPDPTDPDNGDDGDSPITIDGDLVTLNLDSSRFENLKSAGGWSLIEEAELLIVNIDGQILRAFTSVCTHQQCKTSWQFSNDLFICTCHDSRFNTSGEVTSGPANANLQEYVVLRDGSTVTIDKS